MKVMRCGWKLCLKTLVTSQTIQVIDRAKELSTKLSQSGNSQITTELLHTETNKITRLMFSSQACILGHSQDQNRHLIPGISQTRKDLQSVTMCVVQVIARTQQNWVVQSNYSTFNSNTNELSPVFPFPLVWRFFTFKTHFSLHFTSRTHSSI